MPASICMSFIIRYQYTLISTVGNQYTLTSKYFTFFIVVDFSTCWRGLSYLQFCFKSLGVNSSSQGSLKIKYLEFTV